MTTDKKSQRFFLNSVVKNKKGKSADALKYIEMDIQTLFDVVVEKKPIDN